MVEFQRNAFKHALAQGKLQIGLWSSLCSNIAAEIISDSGFDWILLDTEHSPNEIPDLVTQLQAIQRAPQRRSSGQHGTMRSWQNVRSTLVRRRCCFPTCRT